MMRVKQGKLRVIQGKFRVKQGRHSGNHRIFVTQRQ